jgi:hydroxypyruvate reductase
MPAHVLQIAAYGDAFLTQVDADYGLVRSVGQDPLAVLSEPMRAPIRALLTMGTVGATEALMQGLPNLGLICCFGSGYEKVDVAAAIKRGILVTHSPGANASAVADMAITLLLASIRQTLQLDQFVRSGAWTDAKAGRPATVRGLTGRRVGIVGLGDIGLRIAARAAAFEMEIRYHNRSARAGMTTGYEPTLLGLAEWADVLIVACRADATNRNLIDAAILRALGPDGHIVNIARGSVIDEPALIAALQGGVIAGAGLDVFAGEPQVPEALCRLPNVVLSPHRAGGTIEAFTAMHAMVRANLDAFFRDGSVINAVPEMVR